LDKYAGIWYLSRMGTFHAVRIAFFAALAVSGGFTWTVGQSGLQKTNQNLCELWASLPLPRYESCEFQYVLVGAWGLVAALGLLWIAVELFRYLRSWRVTLLVPVLATIFLGVAFAVSVAWTISVYRSDPSALTATPTNLPKLDDTGAVVGSPESERRFGIRVNISREYYAAKGIKNPLVMYEAPADYLNNRLKELNEPWQITVDPNAKPGSFTFQNNDVGGSGASIAIGRASESNIKRNAFPPDMKIHIDEAGKSNIEENDYSGFKNQPGKSK
jgi:hypothetical protein